VRVIAGIAKGRRLRSVAGRSVRPTADRVKEALFSMLGSRFDLAAGPLLDLFAGTGALGIEGLSRGAPSALFVEQDAAARRVLESNLAACGFGASSELLALPAHRAVSTLAGRGRRFAGVLLDPPYGRGLAEQTLTQLAAAAIVAEQGWVAVEHHTDDALAEAYGQLRLTAARRYGKTGLALYTQMAEQVAAS
jgi:16S rRNA (guanine(966)-N(2))-methyltransferase RsmD